jgi:predicted DNA-binding transcriptional regulator AlpA
METLIIISKDELTSIINECIVNAIKSSKTDPVPSQEEEKPITTNEAIEFLGKSRQTFYHWRRKGVVKAHVLGGRIYFFKSELIDAMK